jgi:dipeptidyl aminopeptidase/acylaminoacyl peptidase
LASALEHNPRFWAAELDADEPESPLVAARSPIAYAQRLTTPLLLVHAVDDEVSPIAQSRRMRDAVAPVQPAVRLYEVHGEGHLVNVTGRLSSRHAKLAAIDAFLAEHLAAPDVDSSCAGEEALS